MLYARWDICLLIGGMQWNSWDAPVQNGTSCVRACCLLACSDDENEGKKIFYPTIVCTVCTVLEKRKRQDGKVLP